MLTVAVLTSDGSQIKAYSDIFDQYEALYPQIKIRLDFFDDIRYKQKLSGWLEQGKYDLLYWQAGKRLDRLVEQDLLQPIDSLIDRALLSKNLQPAVLAEVTSDNTVHALPFAHYPWGFYYNKAIFEAHNLQPPKSWQEFIALCHTLKLEGVFPLVQASDDHWPLLSWLDYLSLNVGGVSFRQEITNMSPLNKSQVKQLVELFSELLGNDFFFAPNHIWKWQQSISIVARKQAAMTLMGQFAESAILKELTDDIGYFAFPHLVPGEAKIEVAPLEVWLVPKVSQHKKQVAPLLAFLLESQRNSSFALNLGWLPVNTDTLPVTELSARMHTGYRQLQRAAQLVQYFDRDAAPEYALNVANGIAKSILINDAQPFKTSLLGEGYIAPLNQFVDMNR